MRDTLPFLIRLGLDADADAKTIRRAYARELKRIDQRADPEGFQELRQAYEVALHWQAHQEFVRDDAASPIPVEVAEPGLASEPVTAPALDDPYRLADQAFTQFQVRTQVLVANNESRLQSRWREVLRESLEQECLLNLTARTIFEARIVHLLATGWKPGHETLFVVASEMLDWARDSRRILQFGESGAMVDRAIDQWKLYESMSANAMGTVKQLIQAIRNTPNPQGVAASDDLRLFHQLTDRFYSWFSIIIDRESLQKWHEAAQAEIQRSGTAAAVPLGKAPAESGGKSSWSWSGWQITFLILLLVKGCAALLTSNSAPPNYMPAPTQQTAHENAVREAILEELQASKDLAMATQTGMPPTDAQIEAVRRQIFYVPEPNQVFGALKVSFDVELDSGGKVVNVTRTQGSRDQAYDEAVARTLKHTNVFPPGTQRKFSVSYSYKAGGL
ncbi:protein TonB [Duganella sp. CF458]|uniref:TonB C-terminal domain-containing protein n=1 Tax=Duganella sp. CF458 TaxID=1884368 RepID=UPI0008F4431B|nr:TonB C-terminal domain-containing protein [Duganella sp. CF458]SFG67876.1 protein TonB [Duganella sp. CF458]